MRKWIFRTALAAYLLFWGLIVWRAQFKYGTEAAGWFGMIGLVLLFNFARGWRYLAGIIFGA